MFEEFSRKKSGMLEEIVVAYQDIFVAARGVRRKNKGGCTAIKQYLLSLNRQNLLLQQIQLLHKVLFIQLKSQILYASTEVYIIFVFKK